MRLLQGDPIALLLVHPHAGAAIEYSQSQRRILDAKRHSHGRSLPDRHRLVKARYWADRGGAMI
jgi:hypothetical protein